MSKLSKKVLHRYADGELDPHKAERVELLLKDFPEEKAFVENVSEVGNLLRLMDGETISNVSFEGFSEQVNTRIQRESQNLPLLTKVKVAFGEFFEYRKRIWIPSVVAAGAIAVALIVTPIISKNTSKDTLSNEGSGEIQLLSVNDTPVLSKIESVDFGDSNGSAFTVDNNEGGTVGVVWIVETP